MPKPKFVGLREAVACVKDGDHVWSNAFLAVANPIELHTALGERVRETGSPKNLTFCNPPGFGDWKPGSPNEEFIRLGAVTSVFLGHYASSPDTARMVMDGKIAGYNLPLGVMSKMVRAAAAGETYFITDVGLNLFVDHGEYRLNDLSTEEYVTSIEIDGKRRLKYAIPPMDVVFIKASSADRLGNIGFEKEAAVADALSFAQAVRRQGGKVIVQVEHIREDHQRPWNVIIPAALVDMIVVCPGQRQVAGLDGYSPVFAGEEFYGAEQLRKYVLDLEASRPPRDTARVLVAKRAVQELKPGHLANIGIGLPESVAVEAAKKGLLQDVCLTVEAGVVGGVSASNPAFGAVMGPHCIYTMAEQFDLYDGGGLDICFLGALEIDREGNVNSHYGEGKLTGIGGFANITQATPKVVFCFTFTAGGLRVEEKDGKVSILSEGKHPKFVNKLWSVSFSAKNAHEKGQEILYVTERCVFRLGKKGLELVEVAPGVDVEKDILRRLPFTLE